MDAPALQQALDVLGSELDNATGQAARHASTGGPGQPPGIRIAVYARTPLKSRSSQVLIRRMPDDAAATAQQVFAVLRGFDAQGVQLIWIETLPEAPEWDGVRDRLQRASAA
jgi:L-threonylcarbamoyladenylate synthase